MLLGKNSFLALYPNVMRVTGVTPRLLSRFYGGYMYTQAGVFQPLATNVVNLLAAQTCRLCKSDV